MAKISLVMIVKNEAERLERCVESVRSIVDEFIIVDTGSTDGTQDVIKKFGVLREAPFVNYVESKNAAMKLATGDYILFLDADETVVTGLEFLKEHAETGSECVNAKIIELAGDRIANVYFRPRLWKNDGHWKFEGPGVHEVLVGDGKTITDHRIQVRHDHRHRTPESYRQRFIGYLEILDNYLSVHPNDSRAIFYTGRTYKDLGQPLDAITFFRRYLSLKTGFRDESWQAAHDIALCWKEQGEYDQSLEACKIAESIDPRRAETFVLQGQICFDLQEWDIAIKWFEHASKLPIPDDVSLFMNPQAYFEIPIDYMVLCLDKKKEYRRARELTQKLSDRLPQPDQRLVNNLSWLRRQECRTIFFTLGNTPEPIYGGMIEKQGVGGVETTYLELPAELSKLGHTVFVFCRCEQEHNYNGVNFVPYSKLGEYANWKPDAVITSRWFDPLYIFPSAKKIIWMQDSHFADPNKPDAFQISDAVVCSSLWHRQYIAQRLGLGLDAKKIHIIPLAIRQEFQDVQCDPLKVIYSSNPDRGLYLLMDMWGEITNAVPGIHLAITYGWEGLKTWSDDPGWIEQQENTRKRVEEWANQADNVKITGRLKKSDLYKEMFESSLCLYPNNFWETFCLTALETQSAGVPMVTTRLGALSTTLTERGNVLINHSPFSMEYKREFIRSTIELMHDNDKRKKFSEECVVFAKQQPDWEGVAGQWEHVLWE